MTAPDRPANVSTASAPTGSPVEGLLPPLPLIPPLPPLEVPASGVLELPGSPEGVLTVGSLEVPGSPPPSSSAFVISAPVNRF